MTQEDYQSLVKKEAPILFGFVFKLTKNKSLTQDIVQDVFLKFWEKKPNPEKTNIQGWLIKSARNRYIDLLRKKDNQAERLDHRTEVASNLENKSDSWKEEYQLVLNELDQLPASQKEIFVLKEIEGLSIKEVAHYLDISESKVKVTIHRVRKNIRNSLLARKKSASYGQ
ncbi:MAG: RNA polymerase sigma factor [Flavobacteriales bacterium]|jgi:RNA polymerase sigma-70 factor (ECF subfamily)|nr:RNA polymerase sigma factor [Flavobacteriales bacterium]